jgi:Peptidase family M23
MPRAVVLAAVLLGFVAAPSDASWRPPVRGPVVAVFRHDARTPFRAGQRRGIDLAAAAGAPVRAPCTGPVRFAGPLPRRGLAVTLGCGPLRATLIGLGRLAVRRGAMVGAGAVVGLVGPTGVLRLGARRAGARFGYIDPELLLGPEPTRAPRAAPPVGRRAPRTPAPPAVAPAPLPSPAPLRAPMTAGPPPLAWGGLVLAAAGVPLGGLVRRARRGRRRGVAVASVVGGEGP